MSAFCGIVDLTGSEFAPAAAARVSHAPIQCGLERPRAWSGRGAAFGHAQALVAPEDRLERQPTLSGGGRFVLLFDGYLFDRAGLCRELSIAGAEAGGDSRLAAAFLDRHGLQALARLGGEYAMVRWDTVERQICLAVSPMASRQIYWHRSGSLVTFATTLPGLFAFSQVPRRLDGVALAEDLVASFSVEDATLYHDVKKLPHGTLLVMRDGGQQAHTLWRPNPHRRLRLKRDSDYVEAARDLLEQAVRRRLRAAAPPGATLTGGMDSSAVAVTALPLLGGTLRCYTAVPPPSCSVPASRNRYLDERQKVDDIAVLHPGLVTSYHHSDGPASFEEAQAAIFLTAGRPLTALANIGWLHPVHRAMADAGHRVALTGQMGNMTLSYDGRRGIADLFLGGRWDMIWGEYRQAAHRSGKRLVDLFKGHAVYPLLPPRLRYRLSERRSGQKAWQSASALSPHFADAIDLEGRLAGKVHDGTYVHEPDSRRMRAKFLGHHGVFIGEATQALRSYYGLDFRDPLADCDLADFCLSIPVRQYFAGGQFRSLARRVLAGRLPAPSLQEQVVGDQCPEWFERQSRQRHAYAQTLEEVKQSALASELLDLPRLERLLAQWPQRQEEAQDVFAYRHLISRAIHTGRFIRWVEGANR